jgi:O-antigen/teichoic acid export membrane protein
VTLAAAPAHAARGGLLRAVLTLVAGGAIAQALPLLLGPWLTRLYSPQQFGVYHLFAAVSANLGVVACARYEFALPLIADNGDARALRSLCLRVLAGVTLASAIAAAAWFAFSGAGWTGWLPVAVGVLGWLSLATLWATRAQAYRALAIARVVQYGGAALAQAGAALIGAGVQGLIVAPIAAAAAAAAVLRMPLRDVGPDTPGGTNESAPRWLQLARRFRDFPLLNTPHAFMGALQDTVSIGMIAAWQGPVAGAFR